MKYYLGIDGGGTKSHGVIVDENRKILAEAFGGPTNFLMLGGDTVCETIDALCINLKDKAQINLNQIDTVFLGTTGAGRRTDAQQLEIDFKKHCQKTGHTFKNFCVDSDALAALEGAFEGAPGCILISGTGSIMYGKDAKDVLFRVGGFGRFIGDEGSGYSIGRRGLVAVAKYFDGRGQQTLLYSLLQQEHRVNSPEDLINRIYKQHFDIASFTPTVFQAAAQGDATALQIIDEETDALIDHIVAMKKKIFVQVLSIAFIGGIISGDNIFSRMLHAKIEEKVKGVAIKAAKQSPAFGAALLAIKNSRSNQ